MNSVFIVVSFIIRLIMGALGIFVFVKLYVHGYAAHFLFKDALGWALGFDLLNAPGVARRFLHDVTNISTKNKSSLDVIVGVICSNCIVAILIYPVIIIAMMFAHWLAR